MLHHFCWELQSQEIEQIGKLYLSQRQYIINKLEEFGMKDCKPVGTSILPGHNLSV